MDDVKWKTAIKNAKHYKAIGSTRVFLSRDDETRPWEFVTSCDEGGLYRYGLSMSVGFKAQHPCGLTFEWYLDLERPEANGKATFIFNHPPIASAMQSLPAKAKAQFQACLVRVAEGVEKQAAEYLDVYQRHVAEAKFLRGM